MKRFLRRSVVTTLTVLLMAALLISGVSAANSGGGKVTADALNFRAEASTDSTILACVDNGSQVVVISDSNGWLKVIYKGIEGYMHAGYVEQSKTIDFAIGEGRLTGDEVRLRNAASWEADTITYLSSGKTVSIKGVSGEWYKVEVDGTAGYVHSVYIKVNSASTVTAVSDPVVYSDYTAGQSIIEYAKQFLGIGYVYGGASPSGFDCSGFTSYVFKQSGYPITRTASSQWNDGPSITKDQLIPGDLVFFSSDYSYDIEHVGIYIGDGQFIHSSSGSMCVKINNLTDTYYLNNYYGAVRILQG